MDVNDTDWDGLQVINERNKKTMNEKVLKTVNTNSNNNNKLRLTFLKKWILSTKFLLITNSLTMIIIIYILSILLIKDENNNKVCDTKINNIDLLHSKNQNINSDIMPFIKRNEWGVPAICDYKFQNQMKSRVKFIIPKSVLFYCTHIKGTNCKKEFHDETSYYIKYGYDDIYYHYIVGADGTIYEGRPLDCINDSKFKFENGYSTLVIGIGFCFSDTITSEKISENEYSSIMKLITHLQDKKIISRNYSLDFSKDCENSTILKKFNSNIGNNSISLYSYGDIIENYVLSNMSHYELIKKNIYKYNNSKQMLQSHEELQRHWNLWQPIIPCNIINKHPPYFNAIKIINDHLPEKTFCKTNTSYCSTNWLKKYHENNNITTHFVVNEIGRTCKSMAINCNFNEKNDSEKLIITLQNCKSYENIQTVNVYNGILDIIREYRFYLTDLYNIEFCENDESFYSKELLLLTFNMTIWNKNSSNYGKNCY
ncbi:uncharacterized protein LOC142326070 [Lycorma delicatula]|uniref:uncharacterized protein LOC142326070 n=1 Tax=Lycorma delicatula TaxID=130591 RepID=UPI003F5194DB